MRDELRPIFEYILPEFPRWGSRYKQDGLTQTIFREDIELPGSKSPRHINSVKNENILLCNFELVEIC